MAKSQFDLPGFRRTRWRAFREAVTEFDLPTARAFVSSGALVLWIALCALFERDP